MNNSPLKFKSPEVEMQIPSYFKLHYYKLSHKSYDNYPSKTYLYPKRKENKVLRNFYIYMNKNTKQL